MKAICLPSGDHAGHLSSPGVFGEVALLAARRVDPQDLEVAAAVAAERERAAVGRPVGYSLSSPARVSWRWFAPSASISHSSCADMYAIVRPSGENAGDQSGTSGLRVRLRLPVPSARMSQMSPASSRGGFTR